MNNALLKNEDLLVNDRVNDRTDSKAGREYLIMKELAFIKAVGAGIEDRMERSRKQGDARSDIVPDFRRFEKNGMEINASVCERGHYYFLLDDILRITDDDYPEEALMTLEKHQFTEISFGTTPFYILISESGLYRLLLNSEKSKAIELDEWIQGEIVPALFAYKRLNEDLERVYDENPDSVSQLCKDWLSARRVRILSEEYENSMSELDTEHVKASRFDIEHQIKEHKRKEAALYLSLRGELNSILKKMGPCEGLIDDPIPEFLKVA